MSTATSELPRIPIQDARRNDLLEVADYSELWLKVTCVHHLHADHCYRVDGTVYDHQRRMREVSIDYLETETPRKAPTPPPTSLWSTVHEFMRNLHARGKRA
ncbi:hypothetical protein [Mycobacteroides abscessus]|uniref:hypothetical protein n=1 Tax=Mycobacteroides abscessus TaxID=36809 RepID=UPI0003865A0A|nr:hypothetical protein [Mycobacteroides abscessus]EPZ17552.1 hypothetical protein M879_25955 [Mycobacteroides abscessus V06705]MDO3268037.1 hypothetical protein [Mycobacteroides abscessus subsp. abscessus]SLF48757.1 Uncharacterised protein [Mycobacteroides abscessus subsp. abscessus]